MGMNSESVPTKVVITGAVSPARILEIEKLGIELPPRIRFQITHDSAGWFTRKRRFRIELEGDDAPIRQILSRLLELTH